ncbi:MAG: hypothetical protein ACREIL_05950 [Nitrospiraceae bacterium]
MKEYRVKPGTKLDLGKFDPEDTGSFKKNEEGKTKAKAAKAECIEQLRGL